jgi:HSP20 family molecular chaperone IbpA
MQEDMEKEMRQGFTFSADSEEIVAKEDEKSVSYEIKGAVGSSLNTSVENGYLSISGETKQKKGNFSFQSSFHRMFPLPRNVDPAKMETISEKDKVVLRFPKKAG